MRGFRFAVDPSTRASEKRMFLAAAERRLGKHLNEMAQALLAVDDKAFTLSSEPDGETQIVWNGHPVATLKGGQRLLAPEIQLDPGLSALAPEIQQGISDRLGLWVKNQLERHVPALIKMDEGSQQAEMPAPVNGTMTSASPTRARRRSMAGSAGAPRGTATNSSLVSGCPSAVRWCCTSVRRVA